MVMAAGQTSETGAIAATIRQADIPVLVIAEHGNQVIQSAKDAGHPLPSDALISLPAGQPLDEEIKGKLADKIGSWIIDRRPREALVVLSLAYPFVRRPLAQDAIQLAAAQNAGIGVLVFVPGADLPVMTLNQIKMVLQIAAAYGEPLDKDRIKEIIPTIAGALVCRGIARKVAGFVPALGWLVKGGMGYLGTLAIGEAALTYFEQGGSIAGVAGMLSQAGNAASDAAMKIRNQRAYQVVSDAAGPVARRAASKAVGVAGDVAQSALKGAMDYRKRNRGAKN